MKRKSKYKIEIRVDWYDQEKAKHMRDQIIDRRFNALSYMYEDRQLAADRAEYFAGKGLPSA